MERMESAPMLCKQGVTGSIPVMSTIFFLLFIRVAAIGGLQSIAPIFGWAHFCAHPDEPWH
jgi:hypothetical protein